MDTPTEFNSLISFSRNTTAPEPPPSTLHPEDENYLQDLIRHIRSGKAAVMIVESGDDRLSYMFTSTERVEAIRMMARTIESAVSKEQGR